LRRDVAPGFGEEFGWRTYLLPRLAQRRSLRKALLLHAFLGWVRHISVLVRIGSLFEGAESNLWFSIAVSMLFSLLPAMKDAIPFANVRSASVYHSAFDEVRDAFQRVSDLAY